MKALCASFTALLLLMAVSGRLPAADNAQKPVEVTEVPDQVDLALPDNMSKQGVYSGSTE